MFNISQLFRFDTILFLMVSVVFFMLLTAKSSQQKKLFLFFFISTTIFFKLYIPLGEIRDYFTYTRVLSDKGHMNIRFMDILFEPYFLLFSKVMLYWFSILQVLNFYYFILFILGVSFFSWLALIEDLSIWKKYFIFNLFFILLSFVLLRNGIAYMILAVFFYYLSKNRFSFLYFGSIVFHITTFPVVFLSFFRNKKINFYIVPIVIILILLFSYLFFNDSSIFYLKFKDFKKNSIGYNFPIHNLIFTLSFSCFILYFVFFKPILNNYYYILLIIIYVILYYFNSVMGFRFSFYIILYLIMNTKLLINSRLESILNRFSILFIFLGILTLKLFLFV